MTVTKQAHLEIGGYGYVSRLVEIDTASAIGFRNSADSVAVYIDSADEPEFEDQEGSTVALFISESFASTLGCAPGKYLCILLRVQSTVLTFSIPEGWPDVGIGDYPASLGNDVQIRIEDNYKFCTQKPTVFVEATGTIKSRSFGSKARARWFPVLDVPSATVSQEIKGTGGIGTASSFTVRLGVDTSQLDDNGDSAVLRLNSIDYTFHQTSGGDLYTMAQTLSASRNSPFTLAADALNVPSGRDLATGEDIFSDVGEDLTPRIGWVGNECIQFEHIDSSNITYISGGLLKTQTGVYPEGQKILSKFPSAVGQICYLYTYDMSADNYFKGRIDILGLEGNLTTVQGICDGIDLDLGTVFTIQISSALLKVTRSAGGAGSGAGVGVLNHAPDYGEYPFNPFASTYTLNGEENYAIRSDFAYSQITTPVFAETTSRPRSLNQNNWQWAFRDNKAFRIKLVGAGENELSAQSFYELLMIQGIRIEQNIYNSVGLEAFPGQPLNFTSGNDWSIVNSFADLASGNVLSFSTPTTLLINKGGGLNQFSASTAVNDYDADRHPEYSISSNTIPFLPVPGLTHPAPYGSSPIYDIRYLWSYDLVHLDYDWAVSEDFELGHVFEPVLSPPPGTLYRFTEPPDTYPAEAPFQSGGSEKRYTAFFDAINHFGLPATTSIGSDGDQGYFVAANRADNLYPTLGTSEVQIHVVDALLQILMSTGSGDNDFIGEIGGVPQRLTVDVLPQELGFGLPASLLDLETFLSVLSEPYFVSNLHIKASDAQDVRKFINKNLLEPFFLALVSGEDGRLKILNLASSVNPTTTQLLTLPTLDETNVLYRGRNDIRLENTTEFYTPNLQIENRRFSNADIRLNGTDTVIIESDTMFRIPTENITAKTNKITPPNCQLWGRTETAQTTLDLARRYTNIFSKVIYKFECTLSLDSPITIGTIVEVLLPSIPDYRTGSTSNTFQLVGMVTKSNIDLVSHKKRVTVLLGEFNLENAHIGYSLDLSNPADKVQGTPERTAYDYEDSERYGLGQYFRDSGTQNLWVMNTVTGEVLNDAGSPLLYAFDRGDFLGTPTVASRVYADLVSRGLVGVGGKYEGINLSQWYLVLAPQAYQNSIVSLVWAYVDDDNFGD